MTNDERLELLEQAMELVREARQLVNDAVDGTRHKAHFKAYGEYGFSQLMNEGNPYDSGLETLYTELEEDMFEEKMAE